MLQNSLRIFQYILLSFVLLQSSFTVLAQTPNDTLPVSDLGTRQHGQTYPLKLTAVNVNCDTAQDFEFEIDNTSWLNTPSGASVLGLGPGQSKSIPAQLDFTYIPPGVYYGHVTASCTSCGWFLFAQCVGNTQDVVLKVRVVDPADTSNGSKLPEPPNPYADLRPEAPPSIHLDPRLTYENVRVLSRSDQDKLRRARNRVQRAKAMGERAHDALRNARKLKSDCERELAKLRAAIANAQRKVAIAVQDVKNAEAVARQATEKLRNFASDVRKAKKTMDRTDHEARVMIKYIGEFCQGGSQSKKCQSFLSQVKDYQKKAAAAKAEYNKIKKSQAARKAAAEKAKSDVMAAKEKSDQAKQAVKAAQDLYNTKARECGRLGEALKVAQDNQDKAREEAEQAIEDANKAEARAADQAEKGLEDEIKKKKADCAKLKKALADEVARLQRAMKVGQKLKVFDEDGGRRANMLKQINDKIWQSARDKAVGDIGVKLDQDGNISLGSPEDITNAVTNAMGMLADGLGEMMGAGGAPDVGQNEMLGGLEALAYAVQSQVNAIRNPNTYAAQRNELLHDGKNEETFQTQRMKDMGIGKTTAERKKIQETINKIYRNPDMISEFIKRSGKNAARCLAEIRRLEQRRAALNKADNSKGK